MLEEVKQKSGSISTGMKKAESRMKVITGIQNAVTDCQQHKTVHDKYVRIGWKTVQSVYAESHRDELDAYNKAYRFLKKHGVDLNVDLEALQAEYHHSNAGPEALCLGDFCFPTSPSSNRWIPRKIPPA